MPVETLAFRVYNHRLSLFSHHYLHSGKAMDKLGPYLFEGTLGRGGMGTVFRGKHIETGEVHAVKVLSPVYSNDDHFRGRFESEIKALLKLDHPNIVQLISFGQEAGNLFFSMELVEGNSLFQMQKKGHRFNWRECLKITKDICLGLRHAHDRGIIHRDLKPGNLLMTRDGQIKITDFGIAKSFGSSQNTGDNVLGTMDFMSPEQARGEPVTFRSDLYSLGTVLFTLLSGRPPFTTNSIEESLRNLTRVPAPKVSSVVPDTPEQIDAIIAQLMEKKPEKRFSTAQALYHKVCETEEALKNYSEAKTAEARSFVSADDRTLDLDRSDSTLHQTSFEIPGNNPSPAISSQLTQADRTVVDRKDGAVVDSSSATSSSKSGSSTPRPDFFNRVEKRDRFEEPEEDIIEAQYGKGVLRTLLMLLAVVSICVLGTWISFKEPTADELYTAIQSSSPQLVQDETSKFLELYPDDERVKMVRRIHEFGKATIYYNQLSKKLAVRSDIIGGRLTEAESQFMEIAKLAKSDYEAANRRMGAFITFYEKNPNLSQRDKDCVEAAKSFRIKIREEARRQAKTNYDSIQAALNKAAKTDSEAKAIEIYRSIVELYGTMSKRSSPEVRALVDSARNELKKLGKGETAEPADYLDDSETKPSQQPASDGDAAGADADEGQSSVETNGSSAKVDADE